MELGDGMDFLMRPVLANLCRYESLKDGTLDLEDIMLLNDSLDVKNENEKRYSEAMNEH